MTGNTTMSPPEPAYTFHAARRCMERGISERQVAEALLYGKTLWDDGDKAEYANGRVRVVLAGGCLVVTAFRKRKRNPKRRIQKRRKEIRKYARGKA